MLTGGVMRRRLNSTWRAQGLVAPLCVFVVTLAGTTLAGDSSSHPPDDGASAIEAALIERGESVLPLDARDVASPGNTRKVQALGFYGAARVHEQNEEFAIALRLYQRAHRKDPRSLPILQRIVPLSLHLDHDAEAVRYTIKAVELGYREPRLMRGFALHLTEEGRWADALVMYEALLPNIEPMSSTFVALRAEMGRLAYLAENYREAADAFADVLNAVASPDHFGLSEKNVADLLGDTAVTYEMFADALLKAERLDEAEAVLEQLKNTGGVETDHEFHRARLAAARGDFATALVALEAYLATLPTDRLTRPYGLLNEVLAGLDRSDELLPKLEALRTADGENAPLTFYLAELYASEAQWERAAVLLEQVIVNEPFVEAFEALITVYLETNNAEQLVGALGRVVEVGGELNLLGDEMVDDIMSDADLLTRLFAVVEGGDDNDDDFGEHAAMAWLAVNTGDVARAERLFRRAIELNADAAAEMYSQWGIGLMMAEQYDAAWDVFADGMSRDVISAQNPIFNYLGSGALVMAERYDEALAAAQKAAAANATNPRLASRVAWVLYQAERYDEASQAYVKLVHDLEDNHASSAVRDVLRDARLVLSNLALELDQPERAEEWLEEILDEYPDDISAKNDLGYLWVERDKQLDEALEMILAAVAADPENQAYLDSLGWAYYQLGRYDEAVTELNKAIEGEESPDGVILDHLAEALLKLDRADEARATWQRAAEAFDTADDQERLEEVRARLAELANGDLE